MIRNVPIKLWERKSYRKFENPTDIIYPCILYLPIRNVIAQDKDETTVWNCNTKKWEKKVSYKRYKLVFNVYGRNFSCTVRKKYKVGDMEFIYLSKGYDNNGELSLASIKEILDYELKKYKSLQVRILSVRSCNLSIIDCYCSAKIQILSRYSSDTLDMEVRFLGYMFYDNIPKNTIGIEINRMPYVELYSKYNSYPAGYYINSKDISCFYVSSIETLTKNIETKDSNITNSTDSWLLFNINKLLLPIIALIFFVLLLIFI